MSTHTDRSQENKTQSVSMEAFQMQQDGASLFQFQDNRPETTAQLKVQAAANNSPQVLKTTQLQNLSQSIQKKENNTGLPDNLKSGIENLSGHSMDDVKVHYNSPKPAQLQAHAYAQGTNIHIASGQEKHLPHEAWHVVQQKQGRVKPTTQLKGKVNINDDKGLEREADVMGEKALQAKFVGIADKTEQNRTSYPDLKKSIVQRLKILVGENSVHINEYHFISLMYVANISRSKSKSNHTVVLIPFYDFNGLGIEAERHREKTTSFEYGGIIWGWNSQNELHPEEGKNCVDLSKDEIAELSMIAREEEIPKSTKFLQKGSGKKALSALKTILKGQSSLEETFSSEFSPFKFSLTEAKKYLGHKEGGKTKKPGGFFFPKEGSIEGRHIHLFYESREPDKEGCLSVVDISLKSDSGNHLNGEKWEKPPDKKDASDIELMYAVLQILMRSGKISDEKASGSKAEYDSDEDLEETIDREKRIATYAKMVHIDKGLLEEKIGTEEIEDCETFAVFISYYGNDVAELRAERLGSKSKKEKGEKIKVKVDKLGGATYIFDPDEVESDGDCFFNTLRELGIKHETADELREELAGEAEAREELESAGEWVEAALDMPIACNLWGLTIHVVVLGLDYNPIIVDTYGDGATVIVMAHIYGGHFTPMRPI